MNLKNKLLLDKRPLTITDEGVIIELVCGLTLPLEAPLTPPIVLLITLSLFDNTEEAVDDEDDDEDVIAVDVVVNSKLLLAFV